MTKWRKAQWFLMFSILFGFTFASVGVSYAQSDNGFLDNNLGHLSRGHDIYFADDEGYFGRQEYVCSISSSQLSTLESSYKVSVNQYNYRHHKYDVVIVSTNRGKSAQGIKHIVGRRLADNCRTQVMHSFLYIFTVPELS